MSIELVNVVLFLHITVVIVTFLIAGILHACLHALPRARTVQEMRPFAQFIHRLEPLLPILAVFILGFGAWLVHLEDAGWGTGWVSAPLTALIVIEGLAGALLAPRSKKLVERIGATPDGDAPADLRAATLDPMIWNIAHIATFGFLGVVFVMAVKPHGWIAAIVIVVGAGIGLALSRLQLDAGQKLLSSSGASGSA